MFLEIKNDIRIDFKLIRFQDMLGHKKRLLDFVTRFVFQNPKQSVGQAANVPLVKVT